jgi:hypothetical protein
MIEGDDFVYIFHGKRFVERRAPIDEIPLLKQALRHQIHKIVAGTLTLSPISRR